MELRKFLGELGIELATFFGMWLLFAVVTLGFPLVWLWFKIDELKSEQNERALREKLDSVAVSIEKDDPPPEYFR